jgi:hypothetical protein
MSAGGSKLAWCMLSLLGLPTFSDPRNLDLDPIGAIIVSDISHKPPRS